MLNRVPNNAPNWREWLLRLGPAGMVSGSWAREPRFGRFRALVCFAIEMKTRDLLRNSTLACATLALCAACASTPEVDPVYQPTENILEIIAVLRAHIDDDTYRFQPARDFTGRNVYRSSLLRLENLEKLHPDALRAGHMDGVIAFAKARSLERLRAFDLAAENYRLSADISKDLKLDALRSADICDLLYETAQMTRETRAPGRDGHRLRYGDYRPTRRARPRLGARRIRGASRTAR